MNIPHTRNDDIEPTATNKDICVGGFIMKKNRFLLGKRSKNKDWGAGLWDIVGGHSLKNENPLITLQRETFEETGIQVRDAELMTTTNVLKKNSSGILFTYHIYMVTHYKGKPVNCSSEHTKLEWFTREEMNALPLALPEYLALIDQWLDQQTDTPF